MQLKRDDAQLFDRIVLAYGLGTLYPDGRIPAHVVHHCDSLVRPLTAAEQRRLDLLMADPEVTRIARERAEELLDETFHEVAQMN